MLCDDGWHGILLILLQVLWGRYLDCVSKWRINWRGVSKVARQNWHSSLHFRSRCWEKGSPTVSDMHGKLFYAEMLHSALIYHNMHHLHPLIRTAMRVPLCRCCVGMSTVNVAGSRHWVLRNCVPSARPSLALVILGGYSCSPCTNSY